jgi:hypothetical protein
MQSSTKFAALIALVFALTRQHIVAFKNEDFKASLLELP